MRALPALGLVAACSAFAADAPPKSGADQHPPPKGVSFEGGDGTSCDRPVVIRGAAGAEAAVMGQVAWLRNRYPGYQFKDNQLETRGARKLETISIDSGGKGHSVCFDITESFDTGRLR